MGTCTGGNVPKLSKTMLLFVMLATVARAGDIPPGDVTFAEFQALWQAEKQDTSHVLSVRWEQMRRTKDNGLDSNAVFEMAQEGITEHCPNDTRWLSQRMLLFLRDERSVQLLKSYLNDPDENFRTRIAIDLLHLGEWDAAAPVVAASQWFGVLTLQDSARARPFVEQGLESNDPVHRYEAANVLARHYRDRSAIDRGYASYTYEQKFEAAQVLTYSFGEPEESLRVAAREFLLSTDSTDLAPSRCRFDAVNVLRHELRVQDLGAYMAVIRSDTRTKFGREVAFAFDAVRDLAEGGSQVAADSLAVLYESEWWTQRQEGIKSLLERLSGN